MRLFISAVFFLLGLYKANGFCGYSDESMENVEDFIRKRLDEYRSVYSPGSVPYSTTPNRLLFTVAYVKSSSVPYENETIPGCPLDRVYQYFYYPTGASCCGGDECTLPWVDRFWYNKYGDYKDFEKLPTELKNFKFVVLPYTCEPWWDSERRQLATFENHLDDMMKLPEVNYLIYGQQQSDKWGIGRGGHNRKNGNTQCYYVFATAEDSGNDTYHSGFCTPYEGEPLTSQKPVSEAIVSPAAKKFKRILRGSQIKP